MNLVSHAFLKKIKTEKGRREEREGERREGGREGDGGKGKGGGGGREGERKGSRNFIPLLNSLPLLWPKTTWERNKAKGEVISESSSAGKNCQYPTGTAFELSYAQKNVLCY